jgi:hypothetical protein
MLVAPFQRWRSEFQCKWSVLRIVRFLAAIVFFPLQLQYIQLVGNKMPAFFLQLLHVLPLLSVLFCATPVNAAPASIGSAIRVYEALQRPALGLSPDTQISLLGSNSSTPATIQRWTTHDAPTFAVHARPATAADVQTIVRMPSCPYSVRLQWWNVKKADHISTLGSDGNPTRSTSPRYWRLAWISRDPRQAGCRHRIGFVGVEASKGRY